MPIFLIFSCAFSLAKEAREDLLIRVGDSTAAVRNQLGEPNIEFPLNGQLVQDYGEWVITSRDGVVVAVKQKTAAAPSKEITDPNAPSMKSLMDRAGKGDIEAQYSLAYCYHTGTAVSKNMEAAIRWYTIAAMQGHMAAQHNLGVIYLKGEGVDRDYEQAYTWALLAAANGNDSLVHVLEPRLSGEQEQMARIRAGRIRDGLEEMPYGTPEAAGKVVRKNDVKRAPAVD